MLTIDELDKRISQHIQGGFDPGCMAVMKGEARKLSPGDVYAEIGVDEGRSARVAHEYCPKGVFKLFIDIHDPTPQPNPPHSVGRGPFMEQEGMVGLDRTGFYVHGDADQFSMLFDQPFVNLLFIDGHHDYDSVRKNTLTWEPLVVSGGVILFHDYDHPDTKRWLDEHYGNKKEVFGNKIVKVKNTFTFRLDF